MRIECIVINNETARRIHVRKIIDEESSEIIFFDDNEESSKHPAISSGSSLSMRDFDCDEIRITNSMNVLTYITCYPFDDLETSIRNEMNAIVLTLRDSRNFTTTNLLEAWSDYRRFNPNDSVRLSVTVYNRRF